MALINCPDCEHRVSDRASSCPSCGYPVSEMLGGAQNAPEDSPRPVVRAATASTAPERTSDGACYSCGLTDKTVAISHILLTEQIAGTMDGTIEGKIKTINHGRGLNWMGGAFGEFRKGSSSQVSLQAHFDTQTLSFRVKAIMDFIPELDEGESDAGLTDFLSQRWCDRCSRLANSDPNSANYGLQEASAKFLGKLFLRTPFARKVLEEGMGSTSFFQKVVSSPEVSVSELEKQEYVETYLKRLRQFVSDAENLELSDEIQLLSYGDSVLSLRNFEIPNSAGAKGLLKGTFTDISKDIGNHELSFAPTRSLSTEISGVFIVHKTGNQQWIQVQATLPKFQEQATLLLRNAARLATAQVSSPATFRTPTKGRILDALSRKEVQMQFGCSWAQAKEIQEGNTSIVPAPYEPLLSRLFPSKS